MRRGGVEGGFVKNVLRKGMDEFLYKGFGDGGVYRFNFWYGETDRDVVDHSWMTYTYLIPDRATTIIVLPLI